MSLQPYSGAIESLSGEYERDLVIGARIRDAAESLQWAVGDYVNEMETTYAESRLSLARDLSETLGIPANTLREYARVSRTFPPAKRLATSSWSHHQAASAAEVPAATVQQAATDGLNVRDTKRLAQGLPTGGEATAKAVSSAPALGTNLEEAVLSDLRAATEYLDRAAATIQRSEFRLTVPVGQKVKAKLEDLSIPFLTIEQKIEDEVGSYV